MGCLVKSGGCERGATDALVGHLNRLQKTRYAYRSCLDVVHRETPQPETLYVDESADKFLVIETKSIIWPPNYAAGHAHDHFVADEISKQLASIEFKKLYCLQLPWLIDGNKVELRAFSNDVAAHIKRRYLSLKPGRAIGSDHVPGRTWAFYLQPDEDSDEDGPLSGIYYTWRYHGDSETLMKPDGPPMELKKAFETIYDSCVRKFAEHLEKRRILLLRPYGDLTYMPESWWQRVFVACPPAAPIDEIWQGSFDDEAGGWEFECLPARP